jgi:hypothetical protein
MQKFVIIHKLINRLKTVNQKHGSGTPLAITERDFLTELLKEVGDLEEDLKLKKSISQAIEDLDILTDELSTLNGSLPVMMQINRIRQGLYYSINN